MMKKRFELNLFYPKTPSFFLHYTASLSAREAQRKSACQHTETLQRLSLLEVAVSSHLHTSWLWMRPQVNSNTKRYVLSCVILRIHQIARDRT